MLHWPDQMMAYYNADNVLFSSDAFGQHYSSEFMFDDKVDMYELLSEALKYYANIVAPYSVKVTQKLKELQGLNLPIKCIYVDLFHTRTTEDFVNALAKELIKFPEQSSFGKKIWDFIKRFRPIFSFDNLTGAPQVSFSYQLEGEEQQNLQHILKFLDEQPEQIIIALDEFQQVTEYPGRFEALFRSYIQNLHNIRFIFSGSRQTLMAEMFLSPKRPLFSQTVNVSLDRIPEESYLPFIKKLCMWSTLF